MTNRGKVIGVLERGRHLNVEVEIAGGSGDLQRGTQLLRVRNTPELAAMYRLGRTVEISIRVG